VTDKGQYHVPALLKETISLLEIKSGGKYVDCTLGGGGHSEEILKKGGILLAIDQDTDSINYNKAKLLKKAILINDNFINLKKICFENNFLEIDGILLDLGVSSHQLESENRGFSFNSNEALDMRMSNEPKATARDLVNGLNEGELFELFSKYGEEKFSKKISKAICEKRKIKAIETCEELANLILTVTPKGFSRIHPATKVFQALRIVVNDELNNLESVLPQAIELLKSSGRLAVISFHSLEDGIVKRYFNEMEKSSILKIITNKPIIPTIEEVKNNPRARSAKLRVVEKK
jgi:16S rRNA (cytosine1402-N4)-methyltransferase